MGWDSVAVGKHRHHIVPQFYLRAWAGADGELVAWDKSTGDVKSIGTKGVAYERDAYQEVTGKWAGSNFIEEALAEQEGRDAPHVAAVLDRLQDGGGDGWPTRENIDALVDFALLMGTRNPVERAGPSRMSELIQEVDGEEPLSLAQQIFSIVASLRDDLKGTTIPSLARHTSMIPTSDHPSFIRRWQI